MDFSVIGNALIDDIQVGAIADSFAVDDALMESEMVYTTVFSIDGNVLGACGYKWCPIYDDSGEIVAYYYNQTNVGVMSEGQEPEYLLHVVGTANILGDGDDYDIYLDNNLVVSENFYLTAGAEFDNRVIFRDDDLSLFVEDASLRYQVGNFIQSFDDMFFRGYLVYSSSTNPISYSVVGVDEDADDTVFYSNLYFRAPIDDSQSGTTVTSLFDYNDTLETWELNLIMMSMVQMPRLLFQIIFKFLCLSQMVWTILIPLYITLIH